jgi:hypothetical protein
MTKEISILKNMLWEVEQDAIGVPALPLELLLLGSLLYLGRGWTFKESTSISHHVHRGVCKHSSV